MIYNPFRGKRILLFLLIENATYYSCALDCRGNASQIRQTQMLETIETLFFTNHLLFVLVVAVVTTTTIATTMT